MVYLDNILITGESEEAHLKALDEVLSRLDKARLRVKRSKCEFIRPSVTYLGHKIDANGLHTLPVHVRPLGNSTPLYQLLHKDVRWHWGPAEAKAFAASKELLVSSGCLTHFDSSLPLTLACDASSY